MANREVKIWDIVENIGYQPIKNQSIIVSYAPENLSDAITKFFISTPFYALQICETELVLIPFGTLSLEVKKEVTLEIPFSSIKNVDVKEKGLNYHIGIVTKDGIIELSTQQKELSDLRMTGVITNSIFFSKNWHKENLDVTLKRLKELGR